MSDQANDLRPIQVFLDTKRFIELETPQPFGGGAKDFFKDNDKGFAEHKTRMMGRLTAISDALVRQKKPAGFIKVRQREQALAKSHRPLGQLFTAPHRFALVGSDRVGELVFQTSSDALRRLATVVEQKAEATPRMVPNKETGKLEPRVSAYRSELGGIDDIRLYEPSDRVKFSPEEAVNWLRRPDVIGGYIVELFRPNPQVDFDGIDFLIRELKSALGHLPGGLLVRPILPSTSTTKYGEPMLALSVQLLKEPSQRLIELPFLVNGLSTDIAEASLPPPMRRQHGDLTPARHAALLDILAEQSLVRSVELPPVIETAPAAAPKGTTHVSLPIPSTQFDYPTVGIVDGGIGVGGGLDQWKAGSAGLVPANDRDESHGSFIAGLVSGAHHLNPTLSVEPMGCKYFDLDIFPRRELRQSYYTDIEELFDQLDESIKAAKAKHQVRVFNLSFAIGRVPSRLGYSLAADRLDRIARANDVIFVVAAGNLIPAELRPPWPEKSEDAAAMLAGFGGNQQITAPAEHLLGITVGAVNPPAVSGHEAHMPTTYTRRGPGVGGARKPELADIGGADGNETGLVSLTPEGEAIHNCGTSFAAPLTSATLATLDQRLARQAARETLIALPVHRARRPDVMDKPALRHVARDFVGFGLTPRADAILHDDPHSVTLVFSDKLLTKQRLEFPFTWPKSLVQLEGACRGRADLTLSFTPPVDPDHREEAMRIQLEALLHQEKIIDEATGETAWESQLDHDAAYVPRGMNKTESFLIKTGLKWSPVKRYHASMPQGRGNTSNWRLSLESLVRAGVTFPSDGVSFTLLMTISDPKRLAPVREEMRLDLQSRGLVIADITLAHRIRQRSG